jgi:hypothetical protein
MNADAQAEVAEDPPAEGAVQYTRNAYDTALGWFRVAEAKAQLLLTVNGILISVLFSTLFGKITEIRAFVDTFGVETWLFLFITVAALSGAVACSARSLWSRHKRRVREDFTRLRVDPAVPASYRPEVLWYFAELAHLHVEAAAERLRHCGTEAEVRALAYNTVMLSRNVLRKHRLINAGWALTATALIALITTGTDVIIRAR